MAANSRLFTTAFHDNNSRCACVSSKLNTFMTSTTVVFLQQKVERIGEGSLGDFILATNFEGGAAANKPHRRKAIA